VTSEELRILASWFLSPMSNNSVSEELRVRRLAAKERKELKSPRKWRMVYKGWTTKEGGGC